VKRFIKSVKCSKPGYTSITCSKISYIPYNLIFTTKFNDSLILITIISWDYLNLSLGNEYVDDVTIPTMVIKYNKCCSRGISQSDCSIHIKLNYIMICAVITQLSNVKVFYRPNKYIIDCLAIVYYREIMKICRFHEIPVLYFMLCGRKSSF
jgi:hypothetical protein